DALVLLVDLIGETALAPDIDLVNRATIVGDDLQELVEVGGNLALVQLGGQNDHELVLVRHLPTSFGLERLPGLSRKQEGVCMSSAPSARRRRADNLRSLPDRSRCCWTGANGGTRRGCRRSDRTWEGSGEQGLPLLDLRAALTGGRPGHANVCAALLAADARRIVGVALD